MFFKSILSQNRLSNYVHLVVLISLWVVVRLEDPTSLMLELHKFDKVTDRPNVVETSLSALNIISHNVTLCTWYLYTFTDHFQLAKLFRISAILAAEMDRSSG